MADFRPFSLADSLNAATGAAANTMALRQAQNQMAGEQVFRDTARQAVVPPQPQPQTTGNPGTAFAPGMSGMAGPTSSNAQAIVSLFQKETAGHQKGYNPDYHAQLLEESGYPDRAMAVRELANKKRESKLGMQTQVLDFVARAAPLVTDQQSLDALRGGLQAVGLDPSMIPAEFTPETQQALQVMGMGAAKQVDLMFKQMQMAETKRSNLANEKLKAREVAAKEKEGKRGGAPKYNDVRMRVADLFGGVYDPMTGRIAGLDKDKTTKALAMMARAERIYADADGTKTPAEAATEAAREFGTNIPGVQPTAPTVPRGTSPGGFKFLGYEDMPGDT